VSDGRFERYLTMTVAGQVSYLRRFAVKFIEVVAAGIGTAVSGYLAAYLAGHFSLFAFFTSPAVDPTPPPAIGSATAPHDNASIEATVRAALASHDVSGTAPVVAALQPPTPAAPEASAPPATTAVPLASAEIRSLPVAAAVEPPLSAGPDAWPSNPPAMSSAHGLPPQPPPVNGNVLTALKHFF
jgi:hypothetical protein